VGIGASAGGLAAFEAFFSGMPVDTDPGMAFVLVRHLAPDHKSILAWNPGSERMYGWTMAIERATGKTSITLTGRDETFIIFGTCIPHP